jgi:hypothetical protein
MWKLNGERLELWEGGSASRTFPASGIVAIAAEGDMVVGLDGSGRIHEFIDGSERRSYGSDFVALQISGGVVYATDKAGWIHEIVNGCEQRSYCG